MVSLRAACYNGAREQQVKERVMPAKKKRHPAPKNGERKNGELPGFNVGKNATIREILAEARTFMTPEEYRDFSRKPKDDGGIIKVPKGATKKELYAIFRKNFT